MDNLPDGMSVFDPRAPWNQPINDDYYDDEETEDDEDE